MPKLTRHITARDSKGAITSSKCLVDGKEVKEGYKFCPSCEDVLPLDLFSLSSTRCRECANKAAREYYDKVKHDKEWKDKRNLKVKQKGFDSKMKAIEHMGGKCHDCGGVFSPAVYDFHHLDPTQKEYNIGDIVRKVDFEKVKEELSKCVLLCANCHRVRHWNFEGGLNEV